MPGTIAPLPELLVSTNFGADVARLRERIAQLEVRANRGGTISRLLAQAQLKRSRDELFRLTTPNATIAPPPAAAPTFAPTIDIDRVGAEDLRSII